MRRRGRLLLAAGAPGVVVFLETLVELFLWRADLLLMDVPSLDWAVARLGLGAALSLPALFGLRTMARADVVQQAMRSPRDPSGGEFDGGWARFLLVSLVVTAVVIPVGLRLAQRPSPEREAVRQAIVSLAEAQDRYFEENYHYSSNLMELAWEPGPGTYMLTASREGWAVRVKDPGAETGCAAYYGKARSAPVTPGGRTPDGPNRVVCDGGP